MKKLFKKIAVIAVMTGGAGIVGAWFTGQQVEGVVKSMVDLTNENLIALREGFDIQGQIVLLSVESRTFSSTVRYRIILKDEQSPTGAAPTELILIDEIEHGPFPWTRVKNLNLMPVMAVSNYSIEKTPSTEPFFAATNDQSPLQAHIIHGYMGAASGQVTVLPMDVSLEHEVIKSSGLFAEFEETQGGNKLRVKSQVKDFKILPVDQRKHNVGVQLKEFELDYDLTKSADDFYYGKRVVTLGEGILNWPDPQVAVGLKELELKSVSELNGDLMKSKEAYRVGAISLNGKSIASVDMSIAARDINIPAFLSLLSMLQTAGKSTQGGAARPLDMSHLYELKKASEAYMESKPYVELDKLTIKTANGESSFSLAFGLNKPSGHARSEADQIRHMITSLYVDLKLSKPMLADLLSAQAQLAGTTDPTDIPHLAKISSEWVGLKAVQTGLATVKDDTILASLVYSAGQVDLNDQKMTVEEFLNLLLALSGQSTAH